MEQIQLPRIIVEYETGILGAAIQAGGDFLQKRLQDGGIQRDLVLCAAAGRHARDEQHVCQGLDLHHPRAGIAALHIGDAEGQRRAEDVSGSGSRRAGIQYLRGLIFDNERHLAIPEGLQLRCQAEQGRVHVEQPPHLTGRVAHLSALDSQGGLDDRLVYLGSDGLEIIVSHALIEQDHRRDVHTGLPGAHLRSQAAEQPAATPNPISRLDAGTHVENHAKLSRSRQPDFVAIPEEDLAGVWIGKALVESQGRFFGREAGYIYTGHRDAREDVPGVIELKAAGHCSNGQGEQKQTTQQGS